MSKFLEMSPAELDVAATQTAAAIDNAIDNSSGGAGAPAMGRSGGGGDSVLTELAGNETTKYLIKGSVGTAANIGIAIAEGMNGAQKPNNDPLFGNSGKKGRFLSGATPSNANALGLPKTYSEMKADMKAASRALHQMRKRGGVKPGTPGSNGLIERANIAGSSVGKKSVMPKGGVITLEMARQLGLPMDLIMQLGLIKQLQNAPGQEQIAKALETGDARGQQMARMAAPSVMAEIKAPAPSAGAR